MTKLKDDELDLVFTALADPTRRAILSRLAEGELNPGELAAPYAMSQQAISKHIKMLERAGLVTQSRVSRSRPCQLQPQRLQAAAAWVEEHRQLWETRHQQLDQHLRKIAKKSN